MTMANILVGIFVACGFFVSAGVSRIFRRTSTGVVIGGVVGIAVSVAILYYGLANSIVTDPALIE